MSVETSYSVGTATLETDVVQVIRAWATSFPAELHAFDQQMKGLRKELRNDKGMSEGGNMALYGEIPVKLYRAMHTKYGQHWDRDQSLLKIFWRNFTVGKVNRYASAYKAVEQSVE